MTDIYDFGSEYAKTYTSACNSCGKEHQVSTQGNEDRAEYSTDIYIKCDCEKSVHFNLPVN